MTSKEALQDLRFYTSLSQGACPYSECNELCDLIEKDLEVLDFFKKLFIDIMPIRLTDLQDEKYLSIPNSDIRRPDMLLPITEKEYGFLKEWFRSNLLKEWLGNDK